LAGVFLIESMEKGPAFLLGITFGIEL